MGKKKAPNALICIGLMAILLVSCRTAEQRLQDVSEEIGVPSETMLLASTMQDEQGSQDACYFTTSSKLYSSRLSLEQIIDYYATQLTNNGWTEATPAWLAEDWNDTHLLFYRDNAFQVAISGATPVEIDFLFDEIQEPAEPDTTMFLVTLTYADTIAQRGCPAWQSDW